MSDLGDRYIKKARHSNNNQSSEFGGLENMVASLTEWKPWGDMMSRIWNTLNVKQQKVFPVERSDRKMAHTLSKENTVPRVITNSSH